MQGLVPATSTHTVQAYDGTSPGDEHAISRREKSLVVFTQRDLSRGQSSLVFDWLNFFLVARPVHAGGQAKFHRASSRGYSLLMGQVAGTKFWCPRLVFFFFYKNGCNSHEGTWSVPTLKFKSSYSNKVNKCVSVLEGSPTPNWVLLIRLLLFPNLSSQTNLQWSHFFSRVHPWYHLQPSLTSETGIDHSIV